MCQVNNERERNILREEEDQIGREPIRWRKKRKKRKRKRERGREKIFQVFQRSELNSPRVKVGPHNESYAWAPKSEFFIEAPIGRGSLLL